jgi:MoaA/NifB/PqqE/SkfB family radical SAM enzyme
LDFYKLYKTCEKAYATIPQQIRFLNGRALPPLQIVFELTYRCNLTCEFCYQRREEDQLSVKHSRDELRLDEIQSIIKQTPPWTLIIFSGGEIFIRKDILEILHHTAQKRRFHIVTNGTYITSEIAEELVKMGITSVGVSIEGPEDINDGIRGRNTFSKATSATQMLIDYREKHGKRFPLLNLKTTISYDNVAHLIDIIDIAKRLSVNYCTFQIMNTSLMISGMYFHDTLDPYHMPPPQIADFPLEILEEQLNLIHQTAMEAGVKVRFLPDLTTKQILDHYACRLDIKHYLCTAPWTGLNISATGDVFPCLNHRIGNLREERLMQIWNNERYRNFRLSLMSKGQFAGCHGCCDLIPKLSQRD